MGGHPERIARAREEMERAGLDLLLLSVGADLPYLTGYEAMPLERLTMLVLPAAGEATLVVPGLEAPRLADPGGLAVRPWEETEDPVAIVAGLAGEARRVGIGDHTWARFVLALQEAMPGAEFRAASETTREVRIRKDDEEIALLREAASAADRVITRLDGERFSGRTEAEVARHISEALVEEGHEAAAFAIVASGPNAASPHHEAGRRVMAAGDTVVVDIGGRRGGYHSDTTRTFVIGPPSERVEAAYRALRAAQQAGVEAVRPGVAAEDVDRAAREVLAAAGWGEFFVHRTGHGIGLEVHEDPYIVAGNERLLEPGMAFSVEPGIYVPGEFGMRLEDVVVVTGDGAERLNRTHRDLHVVG